jgi:CHAT domain-containing protein
MAITPDSVSQMVFIPDGPLHYVSFAALPYHAGGSVTPLVATHSVVYAMTTEMELSHHTNSGASNRLLLVADPVYTVSDPRWRNVGTTLRREAESPGYRLRSVGMKAEYERLPGTSAEADLVANRFAQKDVDRIEGFDATRSSILSRPLESYRYIHMAVHGATDPEIPQLSSLILSAFNPRGQRIEEHLWAGDLLTRELRADVVVLSACETAIGKNFDGEGLVGLRYVIVARGAHAVVATLWAVPDHDTARLMGKFYERMLTYHAEPAAALAASMREQLSSVKSDPGFWGAFTVTRASATDSGG